MHAALLKYISVCSFALYYMCPLTLGVDVLYWMYVTDVPAYVPHFSRQCRHCKTQLSLLLSSPNLMTPLSSLALSWTLAREVSVWKQQD